MEQDFGVTTQVLSAPGNIESLLSDADRHLYTSKEKGRNWVSMPER